MRSIRMFILMLTLTAAVNLNLNEAFCAANEHGPHAGYMRSLGDMSVELLPRENGPASIFFINKQWGDFPHGTYVPLMEVEDAAKKKTKIPCAPDKFGVSCTLTQVKLAAGDKVHVVVQDKNKKKVGQVVYTFPFKLQE